MLCGWALAATGTVGAAVPPYHVGDKAFSDVVTPVPLVVIDQKTTDTLRRQAADKVPAIFRHDLFRREQAQRALRQNLLELRKKFLDAMQKTLKTRRLNSRAWRLPPVQKFLSDYLRRHRTSPFTTNLLERWATGASDRQTIETWANIVGQAMQGPVRPDSMSKAAWRGPTKVMLVRVASPSELPLRLASAQNKAVRVHRNTIQSLSRARRALQNRFPQATRYIGRYLARFVQPNCFYEEKLTEQARREAQEGIVAADRYAAGATILKRGQVVDARIARALEELRKQLAAQAPPLAVNQEIAKTRAELERLRQQLEQQTAQRSTPGPWPEPAWLWAVAGGGALGVALLALGFWMAAGRRSRHEPAPETWPEYDPAWHGSSPNLPALRGPHGLMAGPASEPTDLRWIGADPASSHGAQAGAGGGPAGSGHGLRDALLPYLARLLTTRLLQGLISQRRQMIEIERLAEEELARLEQRLEELHAPLQARLEAYEQRIVELEQELTKKKQENRALIEAQIAITRRRLEMARRGDDLSWN